MTSIPRPETTRAIAAARTCPSARAATSPSTRLDLQLDTGVHGLLGPNGAGKTTLMKALATVPRPHDGELRLVGIDVDAATCARSAGTSATCRRASASTRATRRASSSSTSPGSRRCRASAIAGRRRARARPCRPRRPRRPPDEDAVGRDGAARRDRPGDRQRPADPAARRAHRGPGSRAARELPRRCCASSAATAASSSRPTSSRTSRRRATTRSCSTAAGCVFRGSIDALEAAGDGRRSGPAQRRRARLHGAAAGVPDGGA